MSIIMILYYAMSVYLVGVLLWSFVKEKKSVSEMVLYLVIAAPFILRVLRVK